MKRHCEKILSNKDGSRAIYIDNENKESILAYLNQDQRHKKKFKFITEIILGNLRNSEVYDKEDIDKNCKDITAMKFFKGQENDRIYCKEITNDKGTFIVVIAILLEKKKNTKLNNQQKTKIKNLAKYEYEV